MERIFLDHAATTPLAPEARAAMEPWLDAGNASSLYAEGRAAKDALDRAREIVSDSLGCLFGEVVFTSSGTEAANLALVGTALGNSDRMRSRVLLAAAEHHCVLATRPVLERLGYLVELIPVDHEARVSLSILERLLGDDVLLVAVMHANNELGTINPIDQIAELATRRGALLYVDAVQTYLTSVAPVDAVSLRADLISVAAHKIHGPKGAGALFVKSGVSVAPTALGGGQEREMRAGTENVAAIVGFGAAVLTAQPLHDDAARASSRKAFLEEILPGEALISVDYAGSDTLRGHLHLRLHGVSAESMLIVLDRMGVSASSGAACSSGSLEPSHVLLAAGYSEREAQEGLRFTFGRSTSVEAAHEAAKRVLAAAQQVRGA